MAVPLYLFSIKECMDYSQTVEPFLYQLYDLPWTVLNNIGSLEGLKQVYMGTNPLISALGFSIFLGFIFLVVSEINKNYSQVDRMWSILPNLYLVHLAVWAKTVGLPYERPALVASLTTIWSIRLTYNYFRRGGYNKGSEDYRWEILQTYVPKFVWFLFNVTFISFIQSVLLFSFSCIPGYVILLTTKFYPEIQSSDLLFWATGVGLVLSEWISDGQQWTYQTAKHQYYKDAKVRGDFKQADLDRGFNTHGLWAYSRHPNFFAEQTIWFMLYQWSCYASNNLYGWVFAGSGSLILLFQGSTLLTEYITSGKYPEYKQYQKQVGMFLPIFGSYKPPTGSSSNGAAKTQQQKQKQK